MSSGIGPNRGSVTAFQRCDIRWSTGTESMDTSRTYLLVQVALDSRP